MSELSDFLHSEVWPALDAVQSNLLDNLNPSTKGKSAYSLDCPSCGGKRRAYYYPGASVIVCHRVESCNDRITNVWSYLADQGRTNSEVLKLLCDETGTAPPNSKSNEPIALNVAIVKACRTAAAQCQDDLKDFLKERNLTFKQFEQMGWGYYPSTKYIEKVLSSYKCDLDQCRKRGYLQRESEKFDRYKGRVIAFWRDAEDNVGLFGRDRKKTLEGNAKKYKYMFPLNFDKSRPYNLTSSTLSPVFISEGYMDADSLKLVAGVNSCAIGGHSVNEAQALWMFNNKVTEIVHIVDGDGAGIEGGLNTIIACEPLGISVRILMLDPSIEDIDHLRTLGKVDEILDLLISHVSSAEFVARLYVNGVLTGTPTSSNMAIKVHKAYELFTRAKRQECEAITKSIGYPINNPGDSLRVIAQLMDYGMTETEALSVKNARDESLLLNQQGLSRQGLSQQGSNRQGASELRSKDM